MLEDMTMTSEEFAELRAQAAVVAQQDVQLGRLLDMLILHLGHSHGLDPAEEDAKAAELARKQAREEEDAKLKSDAEARANARTAEDAVPQTPEQQAALVVTRGAEDLQVKNDEEALAKRREEEDAQVEAAKHPAEPAAPAPVEPAPVVEQQAEPAAPSWTAPVTDEGETHAN